MCFDLKPDGAITVTANIYKNIFKNIYIYVRRALLFR